MNPYFLVIGAFLIFIKDILSVISIPDDIKKVIKWAFVGYLLYYAYQLLTKSVNKQNALSDRNGALAIELNGAIVPKSNLWFGTIQVGGGDTVKILEIASRIGDIDSVAKWYKELFDVDLFTELQRVLSVQEFQQFSQRVTLNKTNPALVSPKAFSKGDKLYSNVDSLNLREIANPNNIYQVKITKNEYIGDYVGEGQIFTSRGTTYQGIIVDVPFSFGIVGVDVLVSKINVHK